MVVILPPDQRTNCILNLLCFTPYRLIHLNQLFFIFFSIFLAHPSYERNGISYRLSAFLGLSRRSSQLVLVVLKDCLLPPLHCLTIGVQHQVSPDWLHKQASVQQINCWLLPRLETEVLAAVVKPLNPFLNHFPPLCLQDFFQSLVENFIFVQFVTQDADIILVITDLFDDSTLLNKQRRLPFTNGKLFPIFESSYFVMSIDVVH